MFITFSIIISYFSGAFVTFVGWTKIYPPEQRYSEWFIRGWTEQSGPIADECAYWHLKNAAYLCLGIWWIMIPATMLSAIIRGFGKACELIVTGAMKFTLPKPKKKEPELPQLDKYQQLALQEVERLTSGNV